MFNKLFEMSSTTFKKYILYAIFLFILLGTFGILDDQIIAFSVTLLIILFAFFYFRTQLYVKKIIAAEKEFITGDWLVYSAHANPCTTLMDVLILQGVTKDRIKAFRFQTYSLANKYFESILKPQLDAMDIKNKIKLEFLGYGTQYDANNLRNLFSGYDIEIGNTATQITRHVNLIETDDSTYVWFEPIHIESDDNEQYCPKYGAFLIKANDKKKVMDEYIKPRVSTFS